MTDNPYRGEVTFTLAGKDYVVRPTFQLIAQVETAMGMGVIQTLRRLAGMEFTASELVALVHMAVRTAGCRLKREEVGELVVGHEDGFIVYMEPVSKLLSMALAGPTRKEVVPGVEDEGTGGA